MHPPLAVISPEACRFSKHPEKPVRSEKSRRLSRLSYWWFSSSFSGLLPDMEGGLLLNFNFFFEWNHGYCIPSAEWVDASSRGPEMSGDLRSELSLESSPEKVSRAKTCQWYLSMSSWASMTLSTHSFTLDLYHQWHHAGTGLWSCPRNWHSGSKMRAQWPSSRSMINNYIELAT